MSQTFLNWQKVVCFKTFQIHEKSFDQMSQYFSNWRNVFWPNVSELFIELKSFYQMSQNFLNWRKVVLLNVSALFELTKSRLTKCLRTLWIDEKSFDQMSQDFIKHRILLTTRNISISQSSSILNFKIFTLKIIIFLWCSKLQDRNFEITLTLYYLVKFDLKLKYKHQCK
jgi:hypothetical protein